MEAMANLGVVGVLLALVLIIAWVILPFAMFGIKPLLRDLIKQAKITNELLRDAAKKGAKDL